MGVSINTAARAFFMICKPKGFLVVKRHAQLGVRGRQLHPKSS